MNNGIKNVIIFAMGAAVGSVASWYLLKTKYERLAAEEIESVKEAFGRRLDEIEGIGDADEQLKSTEPFEFSKEEKINYAGIVATHYGVTTDEGKGGPENIEVGTPPYTISPDEFGVLDDYDTISLTYYADGVVTDEVDEPIDDVDEKIGLENLKKFGEYEPDVIFVRNDMRHTDYEILKDETNFSDLDSNGDE